MTAAVPWGASASGIAMVIRVTPRGGRDGVDGIDRLSDGRAVLKLRVRVAPEDGAANRAVERLLAQTLGVARRQVGVTAGEKARLKQVAIDGDPAVLLKAFANI